MLNSPPAALDTLNELAAALGDDANFSTTITNLITDKSANAYTNAVSYTDGLRLDSVVNTSVTYVAAANSVKTAYDTAISANTRAASAQTAAASAYTNAVSYADGLLVDSVVNTSITHAAAANSVKTAYDTAISANTNAGAANTRAASAQTAAAAAYTNAVSYTDGLIVDSVVNTSVTYVAAANSAKTAYDTAITANTRAASAQTAAAAAYTNAVSYTDARLASRPALSSCWASNFDIWTRGTSFTLSGGVSQYTSDRTISGPGVGGGANVSRQSFALNESVVDRAGSPYYHAMTWTAVPSAGEGRTGYPTYFSDMEMRVEDVRLTAGQQVTVSCWLWLGSGSIQMFLYAAQAMGSGGAHNKTGNTISGNSAGVDYDHHTTEVFHRSDAITVTATPTLFSKTFNLDDLSAATGVANLGVLTIGHGMNAAIYGPTLNTFGLKYDKGATVLPAKRHEIADLHQYAARHRQVISGIHGIVTSTTAIEISENIHGGFGGNGPTLTMATASPAFLTGGAGVGHSVASGSTLTPSSVNNRQFRGTINGFSGLTVGSPAQSRTDPLIILSQE